MDRDQAGQHQALLNEVEQYRRRIQELEEQEKELLKKVQSKETLNAKILDALPILVFLEDEEGRTVFANKQACERNGLSMEELSGKTVFDFFSKEVAQEIRDHDLSVWKSKGVVTKEEVADFLGEPISIYSGKTIIHLNEDKEESFLLGFGLDISDRVNAEQKLKASEEKFRKLVDQAADSIFLFDREYNFVDLNKAGSLSLGYTPEEFMKLKVQDLSCLSINQMIEILKKVEKEGSYMFEQQMIHRDGTLIPFDTNLGLISIGGTDMYLAICRDVSDRKDTEAKIEHMVYHDSLTGLPNRWFAHYRLQQFLSKNMNHKEMIGVLLLDLDHFKVINDSLGHQTGDVLLQKVARRLQSLIGEDDTLARLGGDEFVLILPHLKTFDEATQMSQKIIEEMLRPFYVDGQKLSVTTSIGMSAYPNDGDDIHSLIKNAEIAMYHSKRYGRSGFKFFNESMKRIASMRLEMEIRLRQALENEDFILHYQPKINLETGGIYGVEALIRWQDKEELIYPGTFIDVAEETGLIDLIGEWVLREACRQCKEWQDAGIEITISVNLSAKQFQRQDLENQIATILIETGLPPSSLELELTESTIMQKPQRAAKVLKNLKKLGLSISIDDFGTGFSSLSYLRNFPIDTLKIDRSFIHNSETDEANAAIALAIINLAHNLNLNVVAEGIENKEQLELMRVGKCDAIQGFYASRPLNKSAVFEVLQKGSLTSFQP